MAVLNIFDELRKRRSLPTATVTDMRVAQAGADFTFFMNKAKTQPAWNNTPLTHWDKPPLSYEDAGDRLGLVLDCAQAAGGLGLNEGLPADAGAYYVGPGLGVPAHGQWRPAFGEATAMKVAKPADKAWAVPAHIAAVLTSQGTFYMVAAEVKRLDTIELVEKRVVSPLVKLNALMALEGGVGKAVRAYASSNRQSMAELPGKGEIPAVMGTLVDMCSGVLIQRIKKKLGPVLWAQNCAEVRLMYDKRWYGREELEPIIKFEGCIPPNEDDDHAVGRLGRTDGPTAPADAERAMSMYGESVELISHTVMGAPMRSEKAGAVKLTQRAGQLSMAASRNACLNEYLQKMGRIKELLREGELEEVPDPSDCAEAAERGAVQRYEHTERAWAAGREGALAAMGGTPMPGGGKRPARGDEPPDVFAGASGTRNRDNKARRADMRGGLGGASTAEQRNHASGSASGGGINLNGGASMARGPNPMGGARGPFAGHTRPSPRVGGGRDSRPAYGGGASAGTSAQPSRQGQQVQGQQRSVKGGLDAAAFKPRFPKSAFTLAPSSLTTAFSKNGVPTGVVDAMEAQAEPGQVVCAFAEFNGTCTKPNCQRCAFGFRLPAQVREAVKAAAVPGLRI